MSSHSRDVHTKRDAESEEGFVKTVNVDPALTSPPCAEHLCSFSRHSLGNVLVHPGKSHSCILSAALHVLDCKHRC